MRFISMSPVHFQVAYYLVLGSFLAYMGLGLWEAWRCWSQSSPRRRWAAAAAAAGIFILATGLTRRTILRGGYPNNHDFQLLAADILGWKSSSPGEALATAGKEFSPLFMTALVDLVSGYSFQAILHFQELLWFMSALLIYAAMRRAGAGRPAAALAGGLYFFNFLAILNTYTFSTTNANIYYVVTALYALACFLNTGDPAQRLRHFVWFLVSAFLVLTARYEFFPVLIWGLVAGIAMAGRDKLQPFWRGLPSAGAILAALGACFALACAWWGIGLLRLGIAHFEVATPRHFARNLNFQLGEKNLGLLTAMPSHWYFPVTVAALLLLLLAVLDRRSGARRLAGLFWFSFLGAWIFYFSMIYTPIAFHALFNMRHHLYFFLPFVLLCGWISESAFSIFPTSSRALGSGVAVSALLTVYLGLNLVQAATFQEEWRTNDMEWQFLYSARKRWPKECRVVVPLFHERSAILRKYFPFEPLENMGPEGCYLTYRSPYYQVFVLSDVDRQDSTYPGMLYGTAWMERVFKHRFFTDYGLAPMATEAPPEELKRETHDPIVVRAGFYRLAPAVQSFLAMNALLIRHTRNSYTPEERRQARLALRRARRLRGPDWPSAAELRGWDSTAGAKFLSDRGVLEALVGTPLEAVSDQRAALRLSHSYLPAYLTLGSLYASLGRLEEASRTYDAALALRFPKAFGSVHQLIRREKAGIASALERGRRRGTMEPVGAGTSR